MKHDIEQENSTNDYLQVIFVCIIPIFNHAILIMLLCKGIENAINRYRHKLKVQYDLDSVKYKKLTKLLIKAGIFNDYDHIEDFMQSGELLEKLSDE